MAIHVYSLTNAGGIPALFLSDNIVGVADNVTAKLSSDQAMIFVQTTETDPNTVDSLNSYYKDFGYENIGTVTVLPSGRKDWGKFTTANGLIFAAVASTGDTGYDGTTNTAVILEGGDWVEVLDVVSTVQLIQENTTTPRQVGRIIGLMDAGKTLAPELTSNLIGMDFSFDGTKYFLSTSNYIQQYNMSTIGDTNTGLPDGITAITSVIDSPSTPGVARFMHSGTSPAIGREVTPRDFVTETSYNATGTVTASAAGYFEIATIAWTANDTGNFSVRTTFIAGHLVTGIAISPEGLNMITVASNVNEVKFWTMATPYDFDNAVEGVTLNPAESLNMWTGCSYSDDGLNVYLHDRDGFVFHYTRKCWSDQALTYTGNSFDFSSTSNAQTSAWSVDGKHLYFNNGSANLRLYVVPENWNPSNAELITSMSLVDANSRDIRVGRFGGKIYIGVTDPGNGGINQYTLGLEVDRQINLTGPDGDLNSTRVQFDTESTPNRAHIGFDSDTNELDIRSAEAIEIRSEIGGTIIAAVNDPVALEKINGDDSIPTTIINKTNGTHDGIFGIHNTDRDLNGIVDALSGSIAGRSSGEQSKFQINKSTGSSGTVWNTFSVLGQNDFEINNSAEFEALFTAGVFTVSVGTRIVLKTNIVTSSRFVGVGGASLAILGSRFGFSITYTGTGDFISGNLSFQERQVALNSGSTGTLFNVVNGPLNIIDLQGVFLVGWDDLGSITGGVVDLDISVVLFWGAGLELIDLSLLTTNTFGTAQGDPSTGPLLDIKGTVAGNYRINDSSSNFTNAIAFIRLDPALPDNVNVVINGNLIGGAGLLFDTNGSTGTFTAVADNSISATAITGVIDSLTTPGVARFQHAGTNLIVGEIVHQSTFATETTYNVSGKVTFVGAGFYDVATIAFTDTDTGSFLTKVAEIASATHGLSNDATLKLDTDESILYDGGFVIFNALTNTFEVNVDPSLTIITETGSWNTSGIDQTDKRVLSNNNPGFESSGYSMAAYADSDFATDNSTVAVGTFIEMIGVGPVDPYLLDLDSQRWKYLGNAEWIYTGLEPQEFEFETEQNVLKSGGGADQIAGAITFDTGSGYQDPVGGYTSGTNEARSISKAENSTATPIGPKVRVKFKTNDTFKAMMANESTATDIDTLTPSKVFVKPV